MADEALETAPPDQLTDEDRTAVLNALNYWDPLELAKALGKVGWTVHEEVNELVSIARNAEKASERFKAMRQLRELLKDAMISSGLLGTVEHYVRREDTGDTTRTVVTVVKRNQQALLEGMTRGKEKLPGIHKAPSEVLEGRVPPTSETGTELDGPGEGSVPNRPEESGGGRGDPDPDEAGQQDAATAPVGPDEGASNGHPVRVVPQEPDDAGDPPEGP